MRQEWQVRTGVSVAHKNRDCLVDVAIEFKQNQQYKVDMHPCCGCCVYNVDNEIII